MPELSSYRLGLVTSHCEMLKSQTVARLRSLSLVRNSRAPEVNRESKRRVNATRLRKKEKSLR